MTDHIPPNSPQGADAAKARVEAGSVWISRDPRDDGLRVTVLEVENGFVRYKRFNIRTVRTENFLKAYRPTVTP